MDANEEAIRHKAAQQSVDNDNCRYIHPLGLFQTIWSKCRGIKYKVGERKSVRGRTNTEEQQWDG